MSESGTIAALKQEQVLCCLLCAQLIELFKIRHRAIVFMADLENETLRRLKFKQNRHWDELSIQKLLSIYVDAAKRELPLSTEAEIQRVKRV